MECALVGSLQHGPEGLDALGMDVAPDILAIDVPDRLMVVGHAPVDDIIVGVDPGLRRRPFGNEAVQGPLVGRLDNGGTHPVGGAVARAGDNRLADRPAALEGLALAPGHVLAQTAHINLVDLDRTRHAGGCPGPGLAQPLGQEVRRFLGDAEVAVQLHARYALERRRPEIDRDGPFLQTDPGTVHHRPAAHAEIAPAPAAPIGQRPARRNRAQLSRAAAQRAMGRLAGRAPTPFLEPALRRRIVRKHLEQLNEGDALAVVLARCPIRHDPCPPPAQTKRTDRA